MKTFIFKIFKRSTKAPFIIYADFECVLIPSTDNINSAPHNKKFQDHFVCSYGSKLICVNERYNKTYETYSGEDPIDKFLNNMVNESEHCS